MLGASGLTSLKKKNLVLKDLIFGEEDRLLTR